MAKYAALLVGFVALFGLTTNVSASGKDRADKEAAARAERAKRGTASDIVDLRAIPNRLTPADIMRTRDGGEDAAERPTPDGSVTTEVITRSAGPRVQPPNDNCANATLLTDVAPFSIPFDSTEAVVAGDAPAHTGSRPAGCVDALVSPLGTMDHDIWYCWTATCTGPVEAATCDGSGAGGVDTRLAVYDGCVCPVTDNNLLGCDDDGCLVQSQVTFAAVQGQSYLIRVGSFPGTDGGEGTLSLTCLTPPCDQPGGNCQAPRGDETQALIRSDNTLFLVADDFTPESDGNITEACWWGAYITLVDGDIVDCQTPDPDDFIVRYYADNGGIPGALIAGPFVRPICSNTGEDCVSDADCTTCSQSGLPCETALDCNILNQEQCIVSGACTDESSRLVVSDRTPTGHLALDFQEYEYSAVHPPVPVSAGECYWIEVSNVASAACPWLWEESAAGNARAYQDNDLLTPPTYEPGEFLPGDDLAYCIDLPTGDPAQACNPPPPANDDCADALTLADGITLFDSSTATTDGDEELSCAFEFGSDQINKDIWYDYVATCTGTLFVDLCSSTFDSRVAVYNDGSCAALGNPLVCDDDSCGPDKRLQSYVSPTVSQGSTYKIRIGGFNDAAAGPGEVHVGCSPDDNVCDVANRDCCELTDGPGPGCNNQSCCDMVCACDPFCCGEDPNLGGYWDVNCAIDNPFVPGCDAATLCTELCQECQAGPVTFLSPQSGARDARQPHLLNDQNARQGFQTFLIEAPTNAGSPDCWSVCDTAASGNRVFDVTDNFNGTYTLTLLRPIRAGATTTITYTTTGVTGTFTSLPGDVNASGTTDAGDLTALISCLNTGNCPATACDIDRQDGCNGADLVREIDLQNGAAQFDSWANAEVAAIQTCP